MEVATASVNGVGTGEGALVLINPQSPVEGQLLRAWAAEQHPGAIVLEHGDPELGRRLTGEDSLLIIPARVSWMPEHSGTSSSIGDLIAASDPRIRFASMQRWMIRQQPDRARVISGAPATTGQLRERFTKKLGPIDRGDLPGFVEQQAILACERAERAIIGDRYKVPRLLADQIASSPGFRERAEALADRVDRPLEDVIDDCIDRLNECVPVQTPLGIEAFRTVLSPLHTRAWTLEASSTELEHLKEINQKYPLVFLPTHRSYVDPLVLAEVMHRHDFPRNHMLGGDNMSFWPIGPLGRRAGVVFIRRNFGDDPYYKLAIKELLGHLLSKRFNLEWYIEGGRTRTGKLRPPKYGLLAYLVRAMAEQTEVQDVMLAPVSIVYDRQSEAAKVAAEQSGAVKSAEGLQWFFDYMRAQRNNVGKARVHFNEPFSLRESLEAAGEGRAQLEKVAFSICVGINDVTPVTPNSLGTLALLGAPMLALNVEQVARLTEPLLDYCAIRRLRGDVDQLRDHTKLEATLNDLVAGGVAERYDDGTEPIWRIKPGGHHEAAYYRNASIHHFVNRSLTEATLVRLAGQDDLSNLFDKAVDHALKMRDLLKFEFFFSRKSDFLEELGEELGIIAPEGLDKIGSPGELVDAIESQPMLIANRVLRSFVDAQLVAATVLREQNPRQQIDRNGFVDRCMGIGKQMLLQDQLYGAEAVSRELFSSALKVAANRDVLDPGREEVQEGRETWLAEVQEVVHDLDQIHQINRRGLREVINDNA